MIENPKCSNLSEKDFGCGFDTGPYFTEEDQGLSLNHGNLKIALKPAVLQLHTQAAGSSPADCHKIFEQFVRLRLKP